MTQITEIIISSAMGILTILAGVVVKAIKEYLIAKGGKKAVEIAEILAWNAVNATEQVNKLSDKHVDKFDMAKRRIKSELEKYNIYMTESQLETFIEAAVKQMNDSWKEN